MPAPRSRVAGRCKGPEGIRCSLPPLHNPIFLRPGEGVALVSRHKAGSYKVPATRDRVTAYCMQCAAGWGLVGGSRTRGEKPVNMGNPARPRSARVRLP